MEYKILGTTDLMISRIGFGCWPISGHGYGPVEVKESIKAIHKAFDMGINFFDTADVYGFGQSETVLARALEYNRKDVIISTKAGVAWDEQGRTYKDCSPDRMVKSLENSLRRLKIDCIPLYIIHWHDRKTHIAHVMEALKKCQEQGKIKYIGCSNFSSELIDEANSIARLESLQMLYNIRRRENEALLKDCFNNLEMGTFVYSVLSRGLFSGKYGRGSSFGAGDTRSKDDDFRGEKLEENLLLVKKLAEFSNRYGKTPAQVAIRWILESPFITCALVGIKSPEQAIENAGAIGWSFVDEHWHELSA